MNKYLTIVLLALFAVAFSACSDDDNNENMVWELVSNSDADMIKVSIDTKGDFSSLSNWRDRSMLGQHGSHKTVPRSAF